MACELCNFCSELDCKRLIGWNIIGERLDPKLKWKVAQTNSSLYKIMDIHSQSELNATRRKYRQNKNL